MNFITNTRFLALCICMLGFLPGLQNVQVKAQDNWDFDFTVKGEAGIVAAGLIPGLAGLYFGSDFQGYDSSQVAALDRDLVNPFDRIAMDQYSEPIAKATDYTKLFARVSPALLLLSEKGRENVLPIAIMYVEATLWDLGWQTFIKNSIRRGRPLLYNPEFGMDIKTSSSGRTSFYSGHTSSTATYSFLTASLYADLFPESKWKPVVWAGAGLLTAATAAGRVFSGYHYPTDVITATGVGVLIGCVIPHMHKKRENNSLSFYPVGGNSLGMGMIKRF